jgi:hypothetical protein
MKLKPVMTVMFVSLTSWVEGGRRERWPEMDESRQARTSWARD